MIDAETEQRAAEDAFLRGSLDIPDDEKLRQMSFVELAALLSSCESGSARFNVVERELKKHLAKDQAKINRFNIGFGACVGGIFGLVGVVLGAYLKDSPAFKQVAPSGTVQQIEKSNLAPVPPIGKVIPSAPPIAQPANHPPPVQTNGQPSNRNP